MDGGGEGGKWRGGDREEEGIGGGGGEECLGTLLTNKLLHQPFPPELICTAACCALSFSLHLDTAFVKKPNDVQQYQTKPK